MQDPDESWAQRMTERCERMVRPQVPREFTIYRVPECIRKADRESFEPKMLSIGPYHHGAERLQAMEEHKWINLKFIFSQHPEIKLVDLLKEIRPVERDIRNCYSEEITEFESEKLVEMMVLDGCFIISILLSLEDRSAWDQSHPIYKTRWVRPNLNQDILLLENQVPFFVLQLLFHTIYESNFQSPSYRLLRLAVKFCNNIFSRTEERDISQFQSAHHLLHLFHWLHRHHEGFERVLVNRKPDPPKMIPSAKEITSRGVTLRSKTDGPLNIEFRTNDGLLTTTGVLKIPTLRFNYQSYSLFRNLVAFEQCSDEYGTDFTSYALFLDCLVDTVDDVDVLKRKSIIVHDLGTDKEVAALINRLCYGISFDARDDFMSSVVERVRKVCNGKYVTWRANFLHHVGGPVGRFKLEIGIIGAYLTALQTFAVFAPSRSGSISS